MAERDWPTSARWSESRKMEHHPTMISLLQPFFVIAFLILALYWIFEFKIPSGK